MSQQNYSFAGRLQELMKDGETQQQFGERVGINRNTIATYFKAKKDGKDRVPDTAIVLKVCRACNVSADWLLGLHQTDTKNADPDMQAVCKYTRLEEEAVTALRMLTEDRGKAWIGLHCLLINDNVQLLSLFSQIPDYIQARNSIPEYVPGDLESLAAKEVAEELADGKEYRLSKSFIKLFEKGGKN